MPCGARPHGPLLSPVTSSHHPPAHISPSNRGLAIRIKVAPKIPEARMNEKVHPNPRFFEVKLDLARKEPGSHRPNYFDWTAIRTMTTNKCTFAGLGCGPPLDSRRACTPACVLKRFLQEAKD